MLRSFNPILRLSALSFQTLMNAYRNGWAGHSECVLPTVASLHGLTMEDIGGDGPFTPVGRVNRFYRNNRYENSLSPGTFVFRPAVAEMGSEPGLLWHPIKSKQHKTWDSVDRPSLMQKLSQWFDRLARMRA